MPTPLDRALQTPARGAFFTFAALVSAAAAWSFWSSDDSTLFPRERFPKGTPEGWSSDECADWLRAVSAHQV